MKFASKHSVTGVGGVGGKGNVTRSFYIFLFWRDISSI